MNRPTQRILRTLSALALLLLAGCAADDRQMAADFFSSFFKDRYATPLNMASYAVGASTGDAEADAALGAADVVRQIKQTDEMVACADRDNRDGDFYGAKTNLLNAVRIRGDDPYLQVRLGGAQLRTTGSADAFDRVVAYTATLDTRIGFNQRLTVISDAIREVKQAWNDVRRRGGSSTTEADIDPNCKKILAKLHATRALDYKATGQWALAQDDEKMAAFYANDLGRPPAPNQERANGTDD